MSGNESMTISIGKPRHLTSDDAVNMCIHSSDAGVKITDECAVTVASWYAGHLRGDGLAMAELATSGTVNYTDLFDDIHTGYSAEYDSERRMCLAMLGTWAADKFLKCLNQKIREAEND